MNIGSKNKKRVVLPSRPELPTVGQILEDINRAAPDDPVFSILQKTEQDPPRPADGEAELRFQQCRWYLELNGRLEEARARLQKQREELQAAGEQLDRSVEEVKGQFDAAHHAFRSQSDLETKLVSLECHFTWDLDISRSQLLCLRDALEDIGSAEGYRWLGHIYNLQGFVHRQLGLVEEARSLFCRAAEAFRQLRNTVSDEGPWLVVNYGNMAWLHHQMGERARSREYLSRVEALMTEYPSPSPDDPHPEICAEKAWTLMKFSRSEKLLAVDFFQRAIRMQPGVVEWQTSRVLALVEAFRHRKENLDSDSLEKVKIAKKHDPENLYLVALYLEAQAQKGARIQDEAQKLARSVLRKPASSYSGVKPLLRLYRIYLSMDEAVDLAEEALERHPDARYIKRCAAICYKRKVFSQSSNHLGRSLTDRAISLHKEAIALYPHSSLKMQISLANIYAKSNQRAEAEEVFEELLGADMDPEEEQMVCSFYARYLQYSQKERSKSIAYYMRAAAIPHQSFYREDSIRRLEKISEEKRQPMSRQIEEFLVNLSL